MGSLGDSAMLKMRVSTALYIYRLMRHLQNRTPSATELLSYPVKNLKVRGCLQGKWLRMMHGSTDVTIMHQCPLNFRRDRFDHGSRQQGVIRLTCMIQRTLLPDLPILFKQLLWIWSCGYTHVLFICLVCLLCLQRLWYSLYIYKWKIRVLCPGPRGGGTQLGTDVRPEVSTTTL